MGSELMYSYENKRNYYKKSYCGSGFQPRFAPGMTFMPGTNTPAGLSQNLTSVECSQDSTQGERNESFSWMSPSRY